MKLKLKQLAAFIETFLLMAVMVCLTGAVVHKSIQLWQYIIMIAIAGVILQRCINLLDKLFNGGEWV